MELLLDAVDSQQVSDDELIGRHGGARCRADASPTRSAQSTDRVNPEVPGWTKRVYVGISAFDFVTTARDPKDFALILNPELEDLAVC
uniref:Uncharacterized protein n=1 Tax=Aegilops tauschii TaxID=37682 RepID=N1R3S5_AEGTA